MEKLGDEFGSSPLNGDIEPVQIKMSHIKNSDRVAEEHFNSITDIVNASNFKGKTKRKLRHYMLGLLKEGAKFENEDSALVKSIENIEANHIE